MFKFGGKHKIWYIHVNWVYKTLLIRRQRFWAHFSLLWLFFQNITVKLLIRWKHQFSKLLKLKNEQHRCKDLKQPVQKMVWYAMFRRKLFEIWGTKIWKNANKMLINCWISSFFRLSFLLISKSFHRNISYHTIFWTNFSKFKNWYF